MAKKIGGGSKRPNNTPARHKYNLWRMWEKNKARRIAKQARKEAKQKARKEARIERTKLQQL